MPTVTASTVTASSNFLIPNGTFIAELIGFVIIVYRAEQDARPEDQPGAV